MGYKPDSTHSITMMVAAFAGVIGWTMVPPLLGFEPLNGADGLFPSVPGMGAAFLAHFLMCTFREDSDSNFLANIEIPKPMLNQGFVALIVIFLISELGYLVVAPDSENSKMGGVGEYVVIIQEEYRTLGEDTQYISDGETLTIEFNTDSIESWPNGDNVVGVLITLLYSEDETSSGIGCLISGGDPEPDTITGEVTHGEFNGSDSRTNDESYGLDVRVEWYDEEWVDNMDEIWLEDEEEWVNFVSGYSVSEIEDKLDVGGIGLGDYKLDITVDVEMGGGQNCEHTDNGEEVEYLIEMITMSHTITPFEEFLRTL